MNVNNYYDFLINDMRFDPDHAMNVIIVSDNFICNVCNQNYDITDISPFKFGNKGYFICKDCDKNEKN